MAGISRQNLGERDAISSRAGLRRARASRKRVASELSGLIVETELTGSPEYLARRLREAAEAQRAGDDLVCHHAYMEVAAAAAAMCVTIETTSPAYVRATAGAR